MHNTLTSNWLVKDKIISQKIIAYINWLMEKMICILNKYSTYLKNMSEWKKKISIKKTSTYPQLTDRQNYIYKRFGSTQLTSNG
jgi:bacterioferritin (cytochrome b1)